MSLSPYILHGENEVLRNFTLDTKIILLGILRPEMSRKFPEQQYRTKYRPIYRLPSGRIQNSVEWIRRNGSPILIQKGSIELRVEHKCAAPKWRLGTELFQHQLLHRVIENSKAGSHAALPWAT